MTSGKWTLDGTQELPEIEVELTRLLTTHAPDARFAVLHAPADDEQMTLYVGEELMGAPAPEDWVLTASGSAPSVLAAELVVGLAHELSDLGVLRSEDRERLL